MENIYLMGSEDVRAAGARMMEAAKEISQAAATIQYAAENHQRLLNNHHEFMIDWLEKLRAIMNQTEGTKV